MLTGQLVFAQDKVRQLREVPNLGRNRTCHVFSVTTQLIAPGRSTIADEIKVQLPKYQASRMLVRQMRQRKPSRQAARRAACLRTRREPI